MRLAATCLPLALLILALPAAAQDRPPAQPTRDVAVAYRTLGDQAAQGTSLRMAWLVAQSLQRIDMGNGQGWSVVNRSTGQGFMVMEQQRMVMQLPDMSAQMRQYGEPTPTTRITREGSDTIARTACTVWRLEDAGRTARACITTDGVMLRVLAADPQRPGREGGLEATEVSFGPQDPARYRAPAGYQTMQMPTGMPGGRPPGR